MTWVDDFYRYKTVIPEEHIPSLISKLKKIPDFSWLLDKPHASIERLQGDIVTDFPTVFLDEEGKPHHKNFVVMILNNTCDLPNDRLDFITVAPVLDFNEYVKFERGKRISQAKQSGKEAEKQIEDSLRGYIEAIRRNIKTELLYLPNFGNFSNGALVLLHLVSSASSKLYTEALNQRKRVASFSQSGFYFLLIKLTSHLARAESADVFRMETV